MQALRKNLENEMGKDRDRKEIVGEIGEQKKLKFDSEGQNLRFVHQHRNIAKDVRKSRF